MTEGCSGVPSVRPPSLGAMDVVVSGSSGLIGTALVEALPAAGHRPIRLVRRAATGDEIRWDPDAGTIDSASLEGVGGVVHLAGAGIGDHRWTDEYKLEILQQPHRRHRAARRVPWPS